MYQTDQELYQLIMDSRIEQLSDSLKKVGLLKQAKSIPDDQALEKDRIISDIRKIETRDSMKRQQTLALVSEMKTHTPGYPVIFSSDTLFLIYNRIGSMTPEERAANISRRIEKIAGDDFLNLDSLAIEEFDNKYDLLYRDMIIMSVSGVDALFNDMPQSELAEKYLKTIKTAILRDREENALLKVLVRIGLVFLVMVVLAFLIWGILKLHQKSRKYIIRQKDGWLKDLSYKDYTFITVHQELRVILFFLNIFRWFMIVLMLYLVLPVVFSIFPFTRGWADDLFLLVWAPFRSIFVSLWEYLPNLVNIVVIVFVFRYFIRFVKYVFSEIEAEKLKISGFHPDWALPTYSIVRFLLLAFMFVLIFPFLPGSDSNIFRGVSVFIGVLFSLGSTSAIANMIAGIVITYMRPFKIGDRIKVGEVTGDVIEKTLLVTRMRTPKNEEITIPNSAILSGNTMNFSSLAMNEGLILHTSVTIGYDVPWRNMHQALLDAAAKTEHILSDPAPFVLQTSLDDFYVSYQLNAYTREASKQANIYSLLHQNIQDVCNEKGIEIMSPHYKALRDGNTSTIPANYLGHDYQSPAFRVQASHEQKTGN